MKKTFKNTKEMMEYKSGGGDELMTEEAAKEEAIEKKKKNDEGEYNKKMNKVARILSLPGELLYGDNSRGYKEHR